MVTHVTQIPEPPVPDDPPVVFHQKASDSFAGLFLAIPQMNQQASEIEQIGADAQAAKERAITEADLALGYRNQAGLARDAAQQFSASAGVHASDAASSAQAADSAKEAATEAASQAAAHAADMGQAVAMAATFASVPPTFQAWMIVVTQPHLRMMIWDGAKYVRAPWHQPCQLFFSYDNPSSIPGALPVRGDVTWQQADFPDVVERLGLSGSGTFTLVEARGEGVRVLDNGRGVDAGRDLRALQLDAFQGHTFKIYGSGHTSSSGGASMLGQQGGPHTLLGPSADGVNGAPRIASETRMRNVAFPLWMTF